MPDSPAESVEEALDRLLDQINYLQAQPSGPDPEDDAFRQKIIDGCLIGYWMVAGGPPGVELPTYQ